MGLFQVLNRTLGDDESVTISVRRSKGKTLLVEFKPEVKYKDDEEMNIKSPLMMPLIFSSREDEAEEYILSKLNVIQEARESAHSDIKEYLSTLKESRKKVKEESVKAADESSEKQQEVDADSTDDLASSNQAPVESNSL